MRPPILVLTVAFGVGLSAGLDLVVLRGAWYVVVPVLGTALLLAQRAPLGAALGVMGVAGLLWGMAAGREREATCAGSWSRERGAGGSKAATVRLEDPAPVSGGIVDAEVLPGTCGGSVRLRWPEGTAARGGTTWVVAGRWSGVGEGGGVLVVRRTRALDPVPRGGGRAARRSGARRPGRTGAGRVGAALGGRMAVGRGRGRGGLGGPRVRPSPAPPAARRARARRDARHRAGHCVRVRHRGADRGAREPHRDPARRCRRAGSRPGADAVVARIGARAPDRRRCGTGPGAA